MTKTNTPQPNNLVRPERSRRIFPELRFPEFTDEWQEKKLDDFFDRITKKNKENNQNILTISAQEGLINQENYFSKIVAAKNVTGYYLLSKGDFAYNKSYSNGYPFGAIKRLKKYDKGIVSTLYICFRSKNDKHVNFLEQYFKTGKINKEINKIAQEGARNHGLLNMSIVDFFNMKIYAPKTLEQQKIAGLLGAVDEKIEKLERKHELFGEYKKSIMQKIFSQQIRFRDENGNQYPDWEEKKFNELFESLPTKKHQIYSNEIQESGEYPVVDQGQNKIAGFTNKIERLFKNNPVVIFGDHTTFVKYINFNFVVGADGTKILKNKNKDNSINFLYYTLKNKPLKAEGYKRHFSILKNKKIKIPVLEEQQKIANFLTLLDNKIDQINNNLTQAKLFKKSLLQKMFV